MRNNFLLLLFSSLFINTQIADAQTKVKKSKKPNIIWIMSDDHSFQTISAYGHPISQLAPTPNIDRIAEKGVVFDQAFVENSICTPSRATLLTGMYSKNHGQTHFGYGLDSSKMFYSEYLQKAGYHTAVFGKWHLPVEPKGFTYYDIFEDQGDYYNPTFRNSSTNGKYIQEKGYATTLVTDHALAWLDKEKDKEEPFCLVILHKAPHRNWMPDLKYLNAYEDVTFPEPPTLFDDYKTRGEQMKVHELSVANHLGYAFDLKVEALKDVPTQDYIRDSWPLAMNRLDGEQRAIWDKAYENIHRDFLLNKPTGKELVSWKYQRYIRDYCKTVKSVDEEVGRILNYLKQNGLEDNTMIVYTSDQGFFMGEHGLYDKRFMYEESFRTPLIMSYPSQIEGGWRSDKLVQNIDFAPTILDVAGVAIPKDMDGKSLIPILKKDKNLKWRDMLYYAYYDYPAVGAVRPHYGVRTDRYKLIHWKNIDPKTKLSEFDHWEFYDLKKDPQETNNVYNKPSYGKIIKTLKEQIKPFEKSM
ncbi:sulfatase [Sphingobacterium sp. SRCM116780]|uniref:sulfatase family protein n=1 Tax=Sphingobacterium sp. SRCM116780 TaxID=2907623 RepID=UPI001F3B71D8|nr:sulfatase [Sphingobacterium sp. SRCM116780]UIR57687.1 sulfatase [Sphingobacterium sp. SRCM116780]